MSVQGGVEVWRGGVNPADLDEAGAPSARFYVARSAEGLVALAAALGLEGAFRERATATLILREQHIRVASGASGATPLHMVAGVRAIGESDARIRQVLVHTLTGAIAAEIETEVSHVTARDARSFAWSPRTRGFAEALRLQGADEPGGCSLAGLPPPPDAPAPEDGPGPTRVACGAFALADCDVFGRVLPQVLIDRVSDGAHARRAMVTADAFDAAAPPDAAEAKLEWRITYRAWPRVGDRFEVRSGLAIRAAPSPRWLHWILDPACGGAWAIVESSGGAG